MNIILKYMIEQRNGHYTHALEVDVVYMLTLDRIGQCIYYEVAGHGTGFSDELDLSEDDENTIYQLFFNSVFLEIYDNDESQEIEFSYSENWN